MRRSGLVYLAMACAGIPATARGQRVDSAVTTIVVPGVVHRHLFAAEGPWSINVLEVNLRQPGISIRAAHANDQLRGRETVTALVRRKTSDTAVIVAAINADFFNLKTGEDENNQVIEGEIWKGLQVTDAPADSTHHVHSQFALTRDGRPVIDTFVLQARVLRSGARPLAVAGVNVRAGPTSVVLYTPRFSFATPFDSTRPGTAIGLGVLARHGDTVDAIVGKVTTDSGGTNPPGPLGLWLPAGWPPGDLPKHADTLHVVTSLGPDRGPLRTLVGGWPRLIVHGQSIADSVDRLEGTFKSFSVTRHPRTGVGFSRDSTTLYLITVDGRQESSSGMSLVEFAKLMLKLGVYEGLNLDGGGSTTMVINGKLVNSPSDPTGERTVGNALLVVQTRHD